jgi:23S rRNA pseudouridine1911/1915/1917 synthase
VGDPEYGRARKYGLCRQFLHAERLAFDHPESGASVELRAPLPEDLVRALRQASGERTDHSA